MCLLYFSKLVLELLHSEGAMNQLEVEGSEESFFERRITRHEFVKEISIIAAGLLGGCTPLKIVFNAFPERFSNDTNLCEQMLRSFVTAVIPGAVEDDTNLIRIFRDNYYPFCEYCDFFVSDLAARSANLFGDDQFDRLTQKQRTAVVRDGLDGDATLKRLYQGAIFMAQVSYYAGIYDDEKGCPLIDFQGSNYGFAEEEMYYTNSSLYLAPGATSDGNYS